MDQAVRKLECVYSASCGYTVGKIYTVYKNSETKKEYIIGNDGIHDSPHTTVSKFKEVK